VRETVTARAAVTVQYEELYRLYRDLYPRTADTVHALASRQER
jgi:xylulokinase